MDTAEAMDTTEAMGITDMGIGDVDITDTGITGGPGGGGALHGALPHGRITGAPGVTPTTMVIRTPTATPTIGIRTTHTIPKPVTGVW